MILDIKFRQPEKTSPRCLKNHELKRLQFLENRVYHQISGSHLAA
ncbi:MAG: hypothetical protein Q4B82_03020 [Alysiella sp.]|nr:hypothetical protein [Alysiella sp.]MDO4433538.1 hypothetical protein [Alysiella sp.]